MEAKEKAQELINKFLKEVFSGEFQPTSFSIICAQGCAEILCDQVLGIVRIYDGKAAKFWEEVKAEIENM